MMINVLLAVVGIILMYVGIKAFVIEFKNTKAIICMLSVVFLTGVFIARLPDPEQHAPYVCIAGVVYTPYNSTEAVDPEWCK